MIWRLLRWLGFHVHDWGQWHPDTNSLYIQKRECKLCQKTEIDEAQHIHDWGSWRVVNYKARWAWQKNSYNESGQFRKCSTCGFIEHRSVI